MTFVSVTTESKGTNPQTLKHHSITHSPIHPSFNASTLLILLHNRKTKTPPDVNDGVYNRGTCQNAVTHDSTKISIVYS